MNNSERALPTHLTENTSSKCFVFRHPNLFNHRSVVMSYAHGRDREEVRKKAIAYANRMNEALGPIPPKSVEGRMSSRNSSGIVRVNPKKTIAKRNGLPYYSWSTRWKGCPQHGGVAWPCLTHTDNGAYVLAALTLELRSTSRSLVLEKFAKVKGTPKYKAILKLRPKLPIEKFWPE